MSHVTLYRKYRSQTFGELVGQDHVVRTLRNGIASGRIAHAYLFTGPRGTGKTSTARLLAKCLCNETGPTPDPDPDSEISRSIAEGSCIDVVEMDAASESGVDDIRTAIVEAVEYKPMVCPYKIFIIDEVHDLSAKAFDALLKTIEEPPAHVVFILATTEYSKVPATIRSRCQKFEFHRGSLSDIVERLQFVAKSEAIQADPAALTAIARMADGGFRDALSLFEQVMLTADGAVTLAQVQEQLGLVSDELIDGLLQSVVGRDIAGIIGALDVIARSGRDPRAVLESMLWRLGDLTRAIYKVDVGGLGDAAQEAGLHETAAKLGPERLLALRAWTANAYREIRDISLPRLWLESQLIAEATRDPELTAHQPAREVKPAPRVTPPVRQPTGPSDPVDATAPKPKAKPEPPQEKPSGEIIDQPVPEPAIEDPELVELFTIWRVMIDGWPSNLTHKMRLMDATVEGLEGQTVIIGMQHLMHLNWFNENPKRIGYVETQLSEAAGKPYRVELRTSKKKAVRPGQLSQAVELPAEGQALHDKVVAVFRS